MTHSIVKDLVWEDDEGGSIGSGVEISYALFKDKGGWKVSGWLFTPFVTRDEAKAACQADYEARILEALDLPAYRREVLEEAVRLLRTIADKRQISGQSKVKCDTYRRAANILSSRANHALAKDNG